jgi:hypothetical protein
MQATVASTAPLLVRLQGSATSVPAVLPTAPALSLTVGAQVVVDRLGSRQLLVVAKL